MTLRTRFLPALGTALAVLAAGCSEGPTGSAPELEGPLLGHSSCGGKVHCGPPGPEANPPIIITFTDGLGDNVRGDRRVLSDDGRTAYVDGECGVQATFNLSDARLDPDRNKIHPKDAGACGNTREPRSVKFTLQPTAFSAAFEWDGTTQDGSFFKVNEVEEVTELNRTVPRTVKAVVDWCDLRINRDLDPNSSFVDVTKIADDTWIVATRPHPDNVGVCLNSDPAARLYYHLPFSITVRLKQP